MTIEEAINGAADPGRPDRLSEIVLRESLGGWQAIAKFHGSLTGPWGVGCDPNPVKALQLALSNSQPIPVVDSVFA